MHLIEVGMKITVVMKNAIQISGTVVQWHNNATSILDLANGDRWIIPRTADDVMLIKIIAEQKKELANLEIEKTELEEEFKETYNQPISDLRLKNLAELKALMNKQEKDIIAQKLKSHEISEVKPVKYEYPNIFKK